MMEPTAVDNFDFKVVNRLLHKAAHEGEVDLVLECLEGIVDVVWELIIQSVPNDSEDEHFNMGEYGLTALHWAVRGGYIEAVSYLIGWAANHNKIWDLLCKIDASGRTPLHIAAIYSRPEIAKFLIDLAEKYGDPWVFVSMKTREFGRTACYFAHGGTLEIFKDFEARYGK